MPLNRQLSLFGVEAADPAPSDLAGLLAGPGEIVRMGGTARVSIAVRDAWRVHVLLAEFALRGLSGSWASTVDAFEVRTSYTSLLAPLAAGWLVDASKRPPAGFTLDGRRLRLWAIAAGAFDGSGGYLLWLGSSDEAVWGPAGSALARLGLAGALLSPGAGGPAYRIEGRKRVARLAELIGDAPDLAPPGAWPSHP